MADSSISDRPFDHADAPRCPRCGSPDVRTSKHPGLIDAVADAFGRVPLRCRSCRTRFYAREQPGPVDA